MRSISLIASSLLASAVLALPAKRYEITDSNGAVASETDVCSRAGIDIMKAGGNAADAMVTTVICVGTVAMYHSGIGGGGFMLIRSPKGKYEYIDFREKAPAAAYEEMFVNRTQLSTRGGLASGVPGELKGLEYLHKNYGKLPWKQVLQPSIDMARNGFVVNKDHIKYFRSVLGDSMKGFLTDVPTWALDFAPDGVLLKEGEIMYRKRFADTLEIIANEGIKEFYEGNIGKAMVEHLKESGGILTMKDLKEYEVAKRKPAHITYRGYKIWSTSAPSSGAVTQSVLKILEGFDCMGDPARRNESTHLLVEAMRFGYAMRAELGDPLFVEGLDAYQDSMTSAETAAEVRAKIDPLTTLPVAAYNPEGLESLDTPGTAQMSTADKSGLAISLTTTVNLLFGSREMVPETGVIMNNQMDDFSTPGSSNAFGFIPSPANFIKPGKRPLSSTTPTIIEDPNGKLYFIIGAAGGSRIISATIQNIWNVIDHKDSVVKALARPRLHDQLTPNVCNFEFAYDNSTVAYMVKLGHNVTWFAPGSSAAQGVMLLPNGTFEAAGEPRQYNSGGYAY